MFHFGLAWQFALDLKIYHFITGSKKSARKILVRHFANIMYNFSIKLGECHTSQSQISLDELNNCSRRYSSLRASSFVRNNVGSAKQAGAYAILWVRWTNKYISHQRRIKCWRIYWTI